MPCLPGLAKGAAERRGVTRNGCHRSMPVGVTTRLPRSPCVASQKRSFQGHGSCRASGSNPTCGSGRTSHNAVRSAVIDGTLLSLHAVPSFSLCCCQFQLTKKAKWIPAAGGSEALPRRPVPRPSGSPVPDPRGSDASCRPARSRFRPPLRSIDRPTHRRHR